MIILSLSSFLRPYHATSFPDRCLKSLGTAWLWGGQDFDDATFIAGKLKSNWSRLFEK